MQVCLGRRRYEYLSKTRKILDEGEQKEIIDYLSAHPKAGDVMQGTGGIRKLRWRRNGKGKRGGVRAIYYYHNEDMPLYLLTAFAKGEKESLSKLELNALAKLVHILKDAWLGGK